MTRRDWNRVANDELLRSCGVEPGLVDVFGNEQSPEEEEREPEQWELDMMEKLERVEKRFADLDGTFAFALSASQRASEGTQNTLSWV